MTESGSRICVSRRLLFPGRPSAQVEVDVEKRVQHFRNVLQTNTVLSEFDRNVFESVVEKVIMGEKQEDGSVEPYQLTFVFKTGLKSAVQCKDGRQIPKKLTVAESKTILRIIWKRRVYVIPKNDNMLAILWMLNSGMKMTAKQISEKLEMNIRTVYRYIDALCASGVPIISDTGHNGGYRLLNHFIRSPLLFDMDEKKALLHAAAFAKEAGYPLSEALDSATSKLKMYSNQEQEKGLSRHLAGFEVINRSGYPSVQPVLAELEQAVANEFSVEMDYRTSHEEQPKNRVIDPYGMVNWNNKWYTVGFCHLRKEIRSFRAERIVQIKRTPMLFKRPEAFSAREFFMQNLLPNLVDKAGLISLRIEGRSEALDDLCLHWFLGHYLKERTANQAIFLLEEASMLIHVPYFLLPYAKSLQVIEPRSMKEKLVAVASELMEYYRLS